MVFPENKHKATSLRPGLTLLNLKFRFTSTSIDGYGNTVDSNMPNSLADSADAYGMTKYHWTKGLMIPLNWTNSAPVTEISQGKYVLRFDNLYRGLNSAQYNWEDSTNTDWIKVVTVGFTSEDDTYNNGKSTLTFQIVDSTGSACDANDNSILHIKLWMKTSING